MKSVNPKITVDYIPECDRELPKEEQTIFELTQLTAEEQAFLQDLSGATGTQISVALNLGLAGARNFYDSNGDPVVFKRDGEKRVIIGKKRPWLDSVLTLIPPVVRDELAAQIGKGVGISEAVAKNS